MLGNSGLEEDDAELALGSMFPEPARPPTPQPTVIVYSRVADPSQIKHGDWSEISIRLVGTHPLWGHHLWNAAKSFAAYLDAHSELYVNRSVLELGAGGGLPGLVTAKNGAKKIMLTDYPDVDLIENLKINVRNNIPENIREGVSVEGFVWGRSTDQLLRFLSEDNSRSAKFDLIIMSDLVFNHSQHEALLNSCAETLALASPSQPAPCLLVFYTHHRPHLAHRDMEFFTKAKERGWICEEILKEKFEPMFPEDSGAEEVRSTVHGWKLSRAEQ